MSRSRPYQKNDNAWVEQKNWTHVRKLVGYRRFTTAAQCEVLRELYEAAADFRNFFQPAMKLKEKVREGGKVRRVYEEPRTPYQRLLELGRLKPPERRALEARYRRLNPLELRRRIEQLRTALLTCWSAKQSRHCPSTGGMVRACSWAKERARLGGELEPKPHEERPGKSSPAVFAFYMPKASAPKLHQRNGGKATAFWNAAR